MGDVSSQHKNIYKRLSVVFIDIIYPFILSSEVFYQDGFSFFFLLLENSGRRSRKVERNFDGKSWCCFWGSGTPGRTILGNPPSIYFFGSKLQSYTQEYVLIFLLSLIYDTFIS